MIKQYNCIHANSRLLGLGLALTLNSTVVGAQQSTAERQQADTSGARLEEVIVTAQKRAENLQDIPLSIAAVDGSLLEERNIANAVELVKSVPNVEVKSAYNASNPIVFVRGIGISDFGPATAGAIGVVLDEVFLNSGIGQMFQMYDLDHVEILKGPQGTLWGRNTTGGVLSFSTRRPEFEFDPTVQMTYGRYNEINVDAASSIPIVPDRAALRVSFASRDRDGTRQDLTTGRDVNDAGSMAGRVQLLVQPNSRLEVLTKLEVGRNRSSPYLQESWGIFDPATGGLCTPQQIRARGICANALGYIDSRDPFSGATNVSNQAEEEDSLAGRLGISYEADTLTFTSISAWNRNDRLLIEDGDSSPLRIVDIPLADERAEQWSQELRLASNGDGDFQWIAGAFYLHEQLRSATAFDAFADAVPTPGIPYLDPTGATSGGFPILAVDRVYNQKTDSYAAFTHLTQQLTPQLRATFGTRYTWETKSITHYSLFGPVEPIMRTGFLQNGICCLVGDPNSVDPLTGLPTAPINAEIDFQKPLWLLALDYKLDNMLYYGRYSRGVRSDSFNTEAALDPREFNVVAPEKIDNFELGMKWDPLPELRLNASAYYYAGELQVATFSASDGGAVPVTVLESADVKGYGVEADMLAEPISGLTLGLNVGLLHTEYTDYPNDPENNGNRLVQAPTFSAASSVRYEFDLNSAWRMSLGADVNYRTKMYFSPENSDLLSEDAYALVNTRVAFSREDIGLEFALWTKNLTDKTYLFNVLDLSVLGNYAALYGMPRTYGVSVRYRY